jgi:aspartate/methionine/tyrosine aminotransferase
VIADPETVKRCWVTKDYTTLGHSSLGELIAIQILGMRDQLIHRNLGISRVNIETLSNWVKENDYFNMTKPDSGFTGFPSYTKKIQSETLCRELLEKKFLMISPGIQFGKEGYLRINTGSKNEPLVEGLRRLSEYMEERK